jgi:hypothetical protein
LGRQPNRKSRVAPPAVSAKRAFDDLTSMRTALLNQADSNKIRTPPDCITIYMLCLSFEKFIYYAILLLLSQTTLYYSQALDYYSELCSNATVVLL